MPAAEENRRDVQVILLGDVGRAYAQLRGFQRRLEIADKNIKTQQDSLDLTTAGAKAGLATELDLSRAAAQLESTKAVVPTLLSGIDVSIHRVFSLEKNLERYVVSWRKQVRFPVEGRMLRSVCHSTS